LTVYVHILCVLMEITNFDLEAKGKPHHHWLLPSSIRCVICGPSGCGEKYDFIDVSCYIPECGGPGHVDRRL
jgi:hypothetical protein